MTIQEAARQVNKSIDTIRRAIKASKLKAQKVKGVWDISEESLLAYAEKQHSASAAEEDKYAELLRLRIQNEKLLQQLEKQQEEARAERVGLQEELMAERERSEQARGRQDTIILQLTRQLDQSQQLLEYHQAPFWRRWLKRDRRNEGFGQQ